MMNGLKPVKLFRVGACVLLAGFLASMAMAQDAAPDINNPGPRVGTFDSRAIAVAYVQSEEFASYMVAQQAGLAELLERAGSAGDRSLVADLGGLGPAMQKRLHEQGFGTAPVDDIIALIEGRLPEIARTAGVDVIVSKWALSYHSPEAQTVDVTELIAAEFDPDERTLEMIRSTMRSAPVPRDEIEHDH